VVLCIFRFEGHRDIAASSVLFVVCRSCCDVMSMCVIVFVIGLTTPAPRVGLPLTFEPFVEMKSRGFHSQMCSMFVVTCGRAGAWVSVYDLLLSMLCESSFVVSIS
jgi:hypothetical protein